MTQGQQVAYWRRNLAYVAILTLSLSASCAVAILLADPLDGLRPGGIPLGFWFSEEGALLVSVLLAAVHVLLMNGLDRRFGVFED